MQHYRGWRLKHPVVPYWYETFFALRFEDKYEYLWAEFEEDYALAVLLGLV